MLMNEKPYLLAVLKIVLRNIRRQLHVYEGYVVGVIKQSMKF